MATTTPRIGLTKPDGTDLVDIAVLNTNFDKIDSNIASTKIQATKPATANAGDLWWDSDTGTLYLYYTDANSSQWVAATSDPINIGVVASQAERDAQYPTPAQGMSVYRTDLGVTQRYYGLFNSSTNPGGRDTAGWYNTEKTASLVPMQPTSIVAASGTATVKALGEVTFTNVTDIQLNGVLNGTYSHYVVDIFTQNSTNANLGLRFAVGGSQINGSTYNNVWVRSDAATFQTGYSLDTFALIGMSTSTTPYHCVIDLKGMQNSNSGPKIARSQFETGGYYWQNPVCQFTGTTVLDGIRLFPTAGTMTGTVIVYGYNK